MAAGGAEVFAVIKAVNDGKEIVGQFVDLVNRYIELPERVNVIQHRLHGCEFALESWERKWGIEERQPTAYYEYFWGHNGWREVRMVIATLGTISRKVDDEINGLIGNATSQARTPPRRGRRYDEAIVKEGVKRIAKSMGKWRRFIKAVKNQASKMDEQIGEFNRSLRALRRISIGLAERLHGAIFSRSGRIRDRERTLAIQEADRSRFPRSRERASTLHQVYEAQRDVSCLLGLTVIERRRNSRENRGSNDSIPNLDTDFQLLLKDRTSAQEVLIVPVTRRGQPNPQDCRNFVDTLRELENNVMYARLSPVNASSGEGFRVYKASDARLDELSRQQSLFARRNRLSQRDKIQIAYTVAQGYMRLVGSPWLDYLDFDNIRARAIAADLWSGLLEVKSSREDIDDALRTNARNFYRLNSNLSLHTQIYRLGVFLTEIALNRKITRLDIDRTNGVRIVLEWAADGPLNPNGPAGQAEDAFSSEKYGDVVFFCLSLFENEEKLKLKVEDLTSQFAAEVLDP